jgi:hypothetical protein
MSFLKQVTSGKVEKPYFVLIYGVEGVGKTTFVANAPSPVFIGTESGTNQMDVSRFPTPKSFTEVLGMVDELLVSSEHSYRTVGIDSLDWIEPLCWNEVCAEGKKSNIKQFPYGEGYTRALKKWQELLEKLLLLRNKMNVILIAHHAIKTFQDPQQIHDYDQYKIKLHDQASNLFKEAVDAVLFADFENYVIGGGDDKKAKASSDGVRVLKTERRPSHEAKNRYGLPYQLPLSWEEFEKAAKIGQPDAPAAILARMEGMLSVLNNEEMTTVVRLEIEKAGGNAKRLSDLENRLKIRVGEK